MSDKLRLKMILVIAADPENTDNPQQLLDVRNITVVSEESLELAKSFYISTLCEAIEAVKHIGGQEL